MKINRQHLLIGLLVLVGVANLADWGLNSLLQGPLQEKRARKKRLQSEIKKRQETLKATRLASARISEWQEQSLPEQSELARSLYRSWLVELMQSSGFRSPFVDSGSPINRSGLFRAFPFTLRGRATLAQMTNFLFLFTESGQLHRIQTLSLTPRANSAQFDIAVTLEALQIPGVDRSDELAPNPRHRLASTTLAAYTPISEDNIFGVGTDTVDPFENTFVTAIVESGGVPQVWITQRLEDRLDKLGPGEELVVDGIRGTVLEILDRDVILQLDGKPVLLTIGESFSESTELPLEF